MVKYRGLNVYLNVKDLAKSRAFYEGLGMRKRMEMAEMGVVGYALGDGLLIVGEVGDLSRADADTRRWLQAREWGVGVVLTPPVDSADDVHEKAKAIGATIEEPPTDQPWGSRTVRVVDPDGYVLMFDQEPRPRRRAAKKAARKAPKKARPAKKSAAKAKKAGRKARR